MQIYLILKTSATETHDTRLVERGRTDSDRGVQGPETNLCLKVQYLLSQCHCLTKGTHKEKYFGLTVFEGGHLDS